MTEELVERVARAIKHAADNDPGTEEFWSEWYARAAISEVREHDAEQGPSEKEIEVSASLMYRRMEEQAFASGAVPYFTEWEEAGNTIRGHYRTIATGFLQAAAEARTAKARLKA